MNLILLVLLLVLLLIPPTSGAPDDKPALPHFTIRVVDAQTNRGIPLVELETTNHIKYVTDSNGIAAVYEHGLMGHDVFFHVKSHGYSYPKDTFGYAGVRLRLEAGGSAEIRLKRENIAERIYRITGEGIYADSLLVGHPQPLKNPTISGLVMGQDSVLSCVYRNKLYWFWGDTNRPAYPLGNFRTSGATSELPGKGGLDPDAGVDLTYFVNAEGFSKELVPSEAPGPIWLGGLLTFPSGDNGERLFAMYSNVDNNMKAQEVGLVEFDNAEQIFRKIAKFDLDMPIKPGGHPFRVTEKHEEYIYFSPVTRVPADLKSYLDPSRYEAYTCLKKGARKDKFEVDRDSQGKAVFSWTQDTWVPFMQDEMQLIKDGKLKPEDAQFHIQDAVTGKPVRYHGASISWNEYRNRYIMIMSEIFGTSLLGEVWYLEADRPNGPWVYAKKIVTHDNYTFYNPRHHPMFDKEGGRMIYFDGTYTNWLTGHKNFTPRYDYNQIMYKLDLADPRLVLPAAVYGERSGDFPGLRLSDRATPDLQRATPIAFYAPDRPMDGTVPVYAVDEALRVGTGGSRHPVFHALPPETQDPPPTTTPLYEYVGAAAKERIYSTDPVWVREGYVRTDQPVCLVWKNPAGSEGLDIRESEPPGCP